jgi:hypothetical protein
MALGASAHVRNLLRRALALAAVPVAVVAVYLTYARAGRLGLAVGAISLFVLSRSRWSLVLHAGAAAAVAAWPSRRCATRRPSPRARDPAGRAGCSPSCWSAERSARCWRRYLAGRAPAPVAVAGARRGGRHPRSRRSPSPSRGACGARPRLRGLDSFREAPGARAGSDDPHRPPAHFAGGNRYEILASPFDAYRGHPWPGDTAWGPSRSGGTRKPAMRSSSATRAPSTWKPWPSGDTRRPGAAGLPRRPSGGGPQRLPSPP